MNFTIKEMNHIFNFIVNVVCDKENELVTITKDICDMDTLLKMFVGYDVKYEKQPDNIGYWFSFINKKKKKQTDIYTEINSELEWEHWSNEIIK